MFAPSMKFRGRTGFRAMKRNLQEDQCSYGADAHGGIKIGTHDGGRQAPNIAFFMRYSAISTVWHHRAEWNRDAVVHELLGVLTAEDARLVGDHEWHARVTRWALMTCSPMVLLIIHSKLQHQGHENHAEFGIGENGDNVGQGKVDKGKAGASDREKERAVY
ncbi:hypothetical protein BU15DRAFT_60772 [Melanogaster broomeanus]|nr:hypothetical protein BU15DRAFT_60772 [Melanogaster broomeanus]